MLVLSRVSIRKYTSLIFKMLDNDRFRGPKAVLKYAQMYGNVRINVGKYGHNDRA